MKQVTSRTLRLWSALISSSKFGWNASSTKAFIAASPLPDKSTSISSCTSTCKPLWSSPAYFSKFMSVCVCVCVPVPVCVCLCVCVHVCVSLCARVMCTALSKQIADQSSLKYTDRKKCVLQILASHPWWLDQQLWPYPHVRNLCVPNLLLGGAAVELMLVRPNTCTANTEVLSNPSHRCVFTAKVFFFAYFAAAKQANKMDSEGAQTYKQHLCCTLWALSNTLQTKTHTHKRIPLTTSRPISCKHACDAGSRT